MTTTTDRAAELRDVIAEEERQMGIHPIGSPLWSIHMAERGKAARELRQMGERR
jgi:hypothetical protein